MVVDGRSLASFLAKQPKISQQAILSLSNLSLHDKFEASSNYLNIIHYKRTKGLFLHILGVSRVDNRTQIEDYFALEADGQRNQTKIIIINFEPPL